MTIWVDRLIRWVRYTEVMPTPYPAQAWFRVLAMHLFDWNRILTAQSVTDAATAALACSISPSWFQDALLRWRIRKAMAAPKLLNTWWSMRDSGESRIPAKLSYRATTPMPVRRVLHQGCAIRDTKAHVSAGWDSVGCPELDATVWVWKHNSAIAAEEVASFHRPYRAQMLPRAVDCSI